MAKKDTISRTLLVALVLCLVCSVVVSTAAVILKPMQTANKLQDRKSNILAAAGMLEEGVSINKQFEQVDTRVVDLKTGTFSDEVNPAQYDPVKAAKNPRYSIDLTEDEDIAKIGRRERYSVVYLVNDDQGNLQKVILPVRGYGLWSTMHGFLALESDLNTVAGLGFHEHGETPGLGGEIDNPIWRGKWPGKELYDADGELALKVVKGSVNPDKPGSIHKVDGLSGATLTTRGVDNLVKFWLGEEGFGPFLDNLKAGEA